MGSCKLYAYIPEEEYEQLKELQKEIRQRQTENIPLSKLARYGIRLVLEEDIKTIINNLKWM